MPSKSKVSSARKVCENCKSVPCKNREYVSNTEMLRVGMKVAMCGGGGKVLEIYGHSALINRQQKYPGGKVCSKRYIVEDIGVDPSYSPIIFDCGPVKKKAKK